MDEVFNLANEVRQNKTSCASFTLWQLHGSEKDTLLDALRTTTSVKVLRLKSIMMKDDELQEFVEVLKWNPYITSLDFSDNSITSDGARRLCQALQKNPNVTRLCLDMNRLRGAGPYIASMLADNTALTKCDFSFCFFDAESVAALSKGLARNQSLRVLKLRGNRGGEGVLELGEALKINSSLTYLDLRQNKIAALHMSSLQEALKVNTSLLHLELMDNQIGPDTSGLEEALKKNSSLTHLDVSWCELTSSFADILDGPLHASLRYWDISGNKNMGPTAARKIGLALAKKKASLTLLGASECDFQAEGAQYLAKCLLQNTSLTSLFIPSNHMGVEGLAHLVKSLTTKNTTLKKLDICHNDFVGRDGAEVLGKLMRENASVAELVISHRDVRGGGEDVETLERAMMENGSVTYLMMGNAMTDVLRQRVEHNKLIHRAVLMSTCTLMCVRKQKKTTTTTTVLHQFPREIVAMIARYLWNTRADCQHWGK